jgi:fumarate hydratase class II
MSVAAVESLRGRLLPGVRALRETLAAKSREHAGVVKIGRTHLQDATPITLGQELSGHVAQLDQRDRAMSSPLSRIWRSWRSAAPPWETGLNAHPELGPRVASALSQRKGFPFVSAPNKFEALAAHDALVFAHGALKTLAAALTKIANDVRWLASGRAVASGRSAFRRTSLAARFCREKSTRHSPKP